MGRTQQPPIQRGGAWLSVLEGLTSNKAEQRQGMKLSRWLLHQAGERSRVGAHSGSTGNARAFSQFRGH